ncbi:hypothetical protein HMPREF2532_02189 [Bacteroides ovatus]|nr:hypothetical protein HMPREF2532_02189 [Bacteroides ovatus]
MPASTVTHRSNFWEDFPQERSIETLSEGGFLCAHWVATGKQGKRHGAQKHRPSEKRCR